MKLQTPLAVKRDIRNGEIKKLYQIYIAVPGSMKTAVVDKIALDMNISVSTVNRIIK